MADTKLEILIEAKDRFSGELNKATSSITSASEQFKKAGAALTAVGTLGAFALKDWIGEAETANRTANQLNAVLTSTKGAAGVSADSIKQMATELQKVTTVGDDAIITGQTMLLSFTKIGKDVFPKATETLLDMAVAMNDGATPSAGQLSSQAIQLGKALNNPTEGLSALTRVGVTFTDAQKKQIETMQKAGDIAGAQKVILAELSTEFGGRAREAAETFSGRMEQMNNRVGDLKENLGNALIPVLEKLVGFVEQAISAFEGLSPATQKTIALAAGAAVAFALIGGPILLLIGFIPTIIAGFTAIGTIAAAMWIAITGPIGLVVLAIAGVGAGIYLLVKYWDEVKTAVLGIVDQIYAGIVVVFDAIVSYLMIPLEAIKLIIAIAFGVIVELFGINVTNLKGKWIEGWNAIRDFLKVIIEVIKTFVVGFWTSLITYFTAGKEPIVAAWNGVWDTVKSIAVGAFEGIKTIVKESINWIIDKINWFIQKANEIAAKGAGALGISVPQLPTIPRLAKGGIVTQPTIAMIGEAGPEAVVPLSGNNAGIGRNVYVTINVQGDVSGEELVEKVGDKLTRLLQLSSAAV